MPNLARSAARTSGGTAGLLANSPNGSPGANASTVNSRRLMPSMLGRTINRRRIRYSRDTLRLRRLPASGLLVPVLNVPGVVVPTAHLRHELAVQGSDAGACHHRDHDLVVHCQLIQLDEHGSTLDGVE